MQRLLNLLARMLHKYGFQSRRGGKRALVTYVWTMPFWYERYFIRSHNAKLTCYLICRTLNSLGYEVVLRSYDDPDVPLDRSYDFFLGHTSTFLDIKNKISLNGKAVLLVTGSSPEFGNAMQHERSIEVFKRRGFRLPVHKDNVVKPAREWHEAADKILILGNDFVRSTWYQEYDHKYSLINNVSAQLPNFGAEGPGNYLFLSSTGQVHRGLDVLLDVFANRVEHLHICSAVLEEANFVAAYRHELFEMPNIHTHGFIDISSKQFLSIVADCKFVILPSCSEGQSSSVINAMLNGLLPIVTRNCGLPDVSACGYLLDDISTTAVSTVMDRVAVMPLSEYRNRREALQNYVRYFSCEQFELTIEQFFRKAVDL